MTLRTEVLAWIMGEVKASEKELIAFFGLDVKPEIESLLDLGVLNRWQTKQGTFYEVTRIWAKPNGNGTGLKR